MDSTLPGPPSRPRGAQQGAGVADPMITPSGATVPFVPEDPEALPYIGRRIGVYEIRAFLARGGMGLVFVGLDTRLRRKVAIKMVSPALLADPAHRARLAREAKLLAQLSHPNLATVYGLESQWNVDFLIMELLVGTPLSERLAHGPLPLREAVSICTQIARGVAAAHEGSIIHRDLKPSNVILAPDGQVKVLDFGIARVSHTRGQAISMASMPSTLSERTGGLGAPGTPGYMSPEQVRGVALDHRTDIFSFGCILFECLSGKIAFDGETVADRLAAVLRQEPDWNALPPDTPPYIHSLLRRCLAKDQSLRIGYMRDVLAEIEGPRPEPEGPPELVVPAPTAQPPRSRWASSPRSRLFAWLAVTSVITAGLTIGVVRRSAAPSPSSSASSSPSASLSISPSSPPGLSTSPSSPSSRVRRVDMQFPEGRPQGYLSKLRIALAKNGSKIIFTVTKDDGSSELWVRELDRESAAPIPGTEGAWSPALSPDGEWVAYIKDGTLLKRRLGGGDSIRIARASWAGGLSTWGTDGFLSFSDWGKGLGRVSENGGDARYVTKITPEKGDFGEATPEALRDNRAILFCAWNGKDDSRIEIVDVASEGRSIVLENGCTPRVAKTPRGDFLLWDRKGTIYAARFDQGRRAIVGPEHVIVDNVLTDGANFPAIYDVSDDGILAYVRGPVFYEESVLTWLGADGKMSLFREETLPFADPHFSADGSKLSVILKRKVYAAYIYEKGRGRFDRITFESDVESAAISPDGQWLAFSSNRNGEYSVWLKSVTSGEERRILEPKGSYPDGVAWSHDGKFVALALAPTVQALRDLWIVEIGPPIQVQHIEAPQSEERFPAFAPNGKWLAYVSSETEVAEVYLRSFPDGAVKRQVSFGGGTEPQWSPDGTKLYYRTDHTLHAVAVSPDDGRPVDQPAVVSDKLLGQSDASLRNYVVGPDGRVLIVQPTDKPTRVTRISLMFDWYQLIP